MAEPLIFRAIYFSPILGLLCLICDAASRNYNGGATIFLMTLSLAVAMLLWQRLLKLQPAVQAIPPLTEGELTRQTGVLSSNTKEGLKVIWYGGPLLWITILLLRGPHTTGTGSEFSDVAQDLQVSFTITGMILWLYASVYLNTLPLAEKLRSGQLSRGSFRRISSTSGIGFLWTVLSALLCMTIPRVVLGWGSSVLPEGHIRSGCIDAIALVNAVYLTALALAATGFATSIVIPWAVIWGKRTWLHVAFLAVTATTGFLTKWFGLWAAAVVAYTPVWDTIICARGQGPVRRIWIFASGIGASFIGLLIGAMFDAWGVRGVSALGLAAGMGFALALDVSLQRWDTEEQTAPKRAPRT